MLGKINKDYGILFSKENYKIIKKSLNASEKIDKHNHPNEDVIFILSEGKLKVFLNKKEEHILHLGDVLNFSGETFINIECLEDALFFVVLVKK